MADSGEGSGEASVSFKVKSPGENPKIHEVTMAETATVLDLKTKLSEAEYENIPVDRQRLIYSGRVMKNEETLAFYKVKAGNTIHLVKSAASNPTPPPAAAASTPQAVPTNMAAGTSANNLLAGLTGARFAGHAPLPNQNIFGPDGGMNIPSEDQMADMLSNPAVAQSMNEALNNPAFVDFMIQQNPMLRDMPNAREMIQSPYFRNMMTNPDALRMASRMRRVMGDGQGAAAFPAPGATDTTPAGAPASNPRDGGAAAGTGAQGQAQAPNPLGLPPGLFEAMGPAFGARAGGAQDNNPFLAMFGPPAGGATTTSPPAAGAAATGGTAQRDAAASPTGTAQGGAGNIGQAQNPLAGLFGLPAGQGGPQMTPEMLQQALQSIGMGSPPPPADSRPPEERYADQLRQLNDMGFYDFDRNIEALRRSGGNVQAAINHLLGD